jgi:predicted nucleotidyltransferase
VAVTWPRHYDSRVESHGHIEDLLAATPEVLFAFLFGSRAAGCERPDSDWDVAVFLDPSLDTRKRFDVQRHLIAEIEPSDRADVIVLNEAPVLLAHRALRGCPLLMRDRASYVRFFVRTMAQAGDEGYWNELHARERRRRLEEGRFGRP